MSPDEVRQHREHLEAVQAAFIEWDKGKYQASQESAPRWRRVQDLEPLASRALDSTGRELLYTMPPQLGGQMVVGLSAYLLAFSTYDGTHHALAPNLRDALVQCIAELRQREDEERARRRKPSYWADRIFRALVSPVGYVIRVVIGVDVTHQPFWGPLSRIASLVFEGIAAFAAGRGLGWW
ncbi:MAG: hypothetical protein QOI39_1662 [Mycobacterium sp.]|nr:hypothetical protein [Mycobacterium sp.]